MYMGRFFDSQAPRSAFVRPGGTMARTSQARREEDWPFGQLGEALSDALETRHTNLPDFARLTGITYEHARKLVKGIAFPSRLLLKEICRVLTLNFDEMDRLLVEDKLRHKYGPRYAEALGENPRYEEVKYDIDALSPENWTLIKNMIKTARRTQFHH
jgi:transcriptional regulator with XRE-family HTH domain